MMSPDLKITNMLSPIYKHTHRRSFHYSKNFNKTQLSPTHVASPVHNVQQEIFNESLTKIRNLKSGDF